MSKRRHTRWMVAAVVLGLGLAWYATRCAEARADSMVAPAGTTITIPGKAPVTLEAAHFVVTRSQLDRANAAAATSRRLTAQLTACAKAVEKASRPEPGWRIAVRWFAVGVATVGAFALGVSL